MPAPLTTRFSRYDDYLAWADSRAEEEFYEVVDGVPVLSPGPGLLHQRCLRAVFQLLQTSAPEGCEVLFAPFDWVLWEGADLQVRQPDAILTRTIADATARGLFEPPMLAVEVLSPTSVERDLVAKRHSYARAGLEHYWVVDPETPQVGIYRLEHGSLVLAQHAIGQDRLTVTEPLSVSFAPADLVRS